MRSGTEFRANWRSLLLAFLGVALSIPVIPLFGWGLFIEPISQAYGWPLTTVTSGLTALTISIACAAPLVGWIIDRVGAYRTVLFSMPIAFGALGLTAFVEGSVPAYLILWVITGVFGMGSSPIVWTRLVRRKFEAGRGLALGMASCGTAAMLMLAKPVVQMISSAYGWQAGVVAFAVLPLVTVYPFALAILDKEKPIRPQSGLPLSADAAPGSWLQALFQWRTGLMLIVALMAACFGGVLPHLERIVVAGGSSPAAAVAMTSAMGVTLLIGRLMAGFLSDRIWSPGLFGGFLAIGGIAMLGLRLSHVSPELMFPSVLLLGLTAGGEFELLAYVTSRYFSSAHYGLLFGLFWGCMQSGGGLWAMFIAHLADTGGNYTDALFLCALASFAGVPIICLLGRRPGTSASSEIVRSSA